MPKVFNMHHRDAPEDAVYIGRRSRWGNPWSHLKSARVADELRVDTREEAIAKFEEWFLTQEDLIEQAKQELKGKDLICFCAPKACHGDILMRIANEEGV